MKFIAKIKHFLKEVLLEIRKINWLGRREVFKYTIIVLFISVVVAMFLGSLDFIFNTVIRKFII